MNKDRLVVEITRELSPEALSWPSDADAQSESLEANHHYIPDIRLARWEDVDRVLALEDEYLPQIAAAEDAEGEWEQICDTVVRDAVDIAEDFFVALDPGVASATLALGAIGCIPFWSCNGGVFGGHHAEFHPCVQFFARADHARLILKCAEVADVGVTKDEHGRCTLFANDVQSLRVFARALRDAELRERD